jgi:SAM-dependent methyltransferase
VIAPPDASRGEFYDGLWRAGADGENRSRWRFQEPLIERALGWVGGNGLSVLEIGPGPGREAAWLIAAGARVFAVDLARSALERTRAATAGAAGVVQAAAEALPFAAGSVDVVFTQTVLMHVDLAAAAGEWARVLRPGGRVVALEPLAGNPLVAVYRWFSPYRRTAPRYLRLADLAACSPSLTLERHEESYLLSVLAAPLPGALGRLARAVLGAADRVLLALPALRRFAWMALVELRRG